MEFMDSSKGGGWFQKIVVYSMIVEGIVWCMESRLQRLGDKSESAAYGLARQSFLIVERAYP